MKLQNLAKVTQNGTFRVAKFFVKENPALLQRYVNTGISVIGLVLTPLSAFMKHLLVIQDIDPSSTPGERYRNSLKEAFDATVKSPHNQDYDEDFNYAFFRKKFEETRQKLTALGLTKESFRKMTDLAKLPGGFENPNSPALVDGFPTIKTEDEFFAHTTELNKIAPESEKKELPLDTKEDRRAYRLEMLGGEAIPAMRKAIQEIEKEIVHKKSKTKTKVSKKKVTKSLPKKPSTKVTGKKKDSTTDPKFKGNFWRVNTKAE